IGWLFKSKVCYDKYGCFDLHPILLVQFPEEPSELGTSFLLFTRKNSQTARIIDDSDVNKLRDSFFEISRRTIFLIHGYLGNLDGIYYEIKGALLNREDCNVIMVDWSKGAASLYGQATGNTRLVGAQIGELIRFLIASTSHSASSAVNRFYIVGHSLGAQIAGYAGSYFQDQYGLSLGRITGLDPASLYFITNETSFRLDESDAQYVDVIHTDAGLFGTTLASGHTDFWPNGGGSQPGCIFNACDHSRAQKYFLASVEGSCSWKAYPCADYDTFLKGSCTSCNGECPSLGFDADLTKKGGSFYLETTSNDPFCGTISRLNQLGQYGQFRSFLGTVFFTPGDKIREDENFILARKKKSALLKGSIKTDVMLFSPHVTNVSDRSVCVFHVLLGNLEGIYYEIKGALLNREDCNVIMVDWSKGAASPYGQATGNARLVGAQIGELIRFLIASTSHSHSSAVNRFYIVGHSLGAQVAGYAGSYLQDKYGLSLGRITGLDPASLFFITVSTSFRLDKSDAQYVDVIHTNAGIQGTIRVSGHTDFWPNGGSIQPGCPLSDLTKS
ncbi:unnamed protein product, partial [Porites evermanni]